MKYAFQPWSFLVSMPTSIRFLVGTAISVIIGSIYVYYFQYFNGGFLGNPAASIGNFLLVHLLAFCWMYWWTLSLDNWPFCLWMPQPFQGLAVGICSVILGYFTYYIFNNILGWAVQIFPFGTWWLFFTFAIPAWMGGLIPDAYGRKQPITGISVLIASIGLATIFWWFTLGVTTSSVLTGIGDSGVPLGMPFVWFAAAVIFAFALEMWPFQVKQPAQFVLFVGYLACYSIFYLWFLHALNMDFFVGPPLHGAVFTICWMLPALFWIGMGQGAPLHTLSVWLRGIVIIALSVIAGFIFFKLYILQAAPPDWKSPAHAIYMTSCLNWTIGIFIGWGITWCNMGWLYLPPAFKPGQDAALQDAVQ
ncbi:MAG: hypothetical protein M1130_12310 [Actinobacteria bacterium]|nr:hypothetical protein [Actinomycetota bacterium]